jgi:hypothetical protein
MRVSLPLTAERGRISAVLAVLGVLATTAVFAAMAPSAAHASFTIAKCGGSAVQGEGSSLQKAAQQQFWIPTVFDSSFGCGSGAPVVTYNPDGSGCGIASLGGGPTSSKCSDFEGTEAINGYRAKVTRFAGSDAPLTPAQKSAAEASGGPSPGVIHEIPVASAAVAVIVHFPEGCELKDPGTGTPASGAGTLNDNASTGGVNDPTGVGTGDTLANETLRVHIKAEEMEKVWDGAVAQTWGNIVPEADFRTGTTHTQKECAETPVVRIVRQDGSGTTYNFKAYLSLLPTAPAGLWTTTPIVGDNTTWPVTGSSKTVPVEVNPANNVCEDAGHICHGKEKGGGSLASAVEATNGSISYVDLATGRQKGFDVVAKKDDHTYWIPLQTINPAKGNEVGANYVEPTVSPISHVNGNGAPTGANCTNADYRGIPATPASDPTLGDWSNAIATGSEDGVTYPACALTYDFAFDDDAPVYGNTQIEQERARTVFDYLSAVESNAGQLGLASADYGTLSLSMIQIGQKGVAAIDWNKAAGSGGPKEEVKKTPPVEAKTIISTPITTPPSNAFSIAGAKIKGKAISLSLVLPGSGSVQVKATGGGVTVSSVTASVSGGSGTVTLSISKAALKKLAKVKGHKLSVKITVTFTPTGGSAASKVKTLTLTQAALTSKKKATKGKKK